MLKNINVQIISFLFGYVKYNLYIYLFFKSNHFFFEKSHIIFGYSKNKYYLCNIKMKLKMIW